MDRSHLGYTVKFITLKFEYASCSGRVCSKQNDLMYFSSKCVISQKLQGFLSTKVDKTIRSNERLKPGTIKPQCYSPSLPTPTPSSYSAPQRPLYSLSFCKAIFCVSVAYGGKCLMVPQEFLSQCPAPSILSQEFQPRITDSLEGNPSAASLQSWFQGTDSQTEGQKVGISLGLE